MYTDKVIRIATKDSTIFGDILFYLHLDFVIRFKFIANFFVLQDGIVNKFGARNAQKNDILLVLQKYLNALCQV